jgi:patatin-like phospholipase/acyl hydrolase
VNKDRSGGGRESRANALNPVVYGGGVRGLSSLLILKQLMKRVNPKDPPKPCDYFNLIGGTSTGG